ncbi:hypothetical protein L6472_06120 [Prevotella sp. E13-17]|uniref:hypothetical protein n=1 Tax=Prevotella sp. E13-17 TaxID=2913616 RepID=UPI001ED9D6C4|nr:hypothetical protein [Prevotella sp. E13-17]UKK52154.1 hypothetical protein L6472_06120 [Prevotella sp. E13-17]
MLKVYQLRRNQNSFDVTFKYRGVSVRCEFVDGNTYNGTPAKCYTRDEFKQRAIEASELYKNKEIILERQVEEASDIAKKAAKAAARAAKADLGNSTPPPPTPTPPSTPTPTVDDEDPGGDGMQKMTFDNLGEAIQYIAANWQVQVQSEAEARAFLKEHQIQPTIKRG